MEEDEEEVQRGTVTESQLPLHSCLIPNPASQPDRIAIRQLSDLCVVCCRTKQTWTVIDRRSAEEPLQPSEPYAEG
jgi:hypothetical protein